MTAPVEDQVDAPDEAPPPAPDPEAPYGRRADGTAYRASVDERERLVAQLAAARSARAAGGGRRRASAPPRKQGAKRAPAAAGPDYAATVEQLLQLPILALGLAARANRAFALDAATLTVFAPPLARAVADQAAQDARLAAVLDRCMAVAPAGPLVGILLAMGMQVAANHGKIPANPDLGILSEEALMGAVEQRMQAAA